jgi:hypothetical protein
MGGVLRDPLRPFPNITTCPSSPGARKPISVTIPVDLLGKKRTMIQKAIVSHGKTKMGTMVRRGKLPYVRRSRSL